MFAKKLQRGIVISPSFLSWVEVGGTSAQPVLVGSCLEELPEGLVTPSFARENITDSSLLREIMEKLIPAGKKSGDVSLTIPDAVLKISVLNFDELPRKREEIERLILWRLKKSIPLAPEMVKVDYSISPAENGSIDVIAAVASRKVIREYEGLLINAGLKPKIVDVSLMNLLNFFIGQLKESFLFLTVNHRSISISIIGDGKVKLFRHKECEIMEDRIVKEVFATLTFYRKQFPQHSLEAAYLFSQTEKVNGFLSERLSASFGGDVTELKMASVFGQADGDTPLSEHLAAAIGGALRLE